MIRLSILFYFIKFFILKQFYFFKNSCYTNQEKLYILCSDVIITWALVENINTNKNISHSVALNPPCFLYSYILTRWMYHTKCKLYLRLWTKQRMYWFSNELFFYLLMYLITYSDSKIMHLHLDIYEIRNSIYFKKVFSSVVFLKDKLSKHWIKWKMFLMIIFTEYLFLNIYSHKSKNNIRYSTFSKIINNVLIILIQTW